MDLAYWGFDRWPFDRRKSSGGPNVGASHEEAMARLMFLVDERRRCGMLTGPAGIGKSRLFRRVQSHALRHGRLCVDFDATGIEADEFVSQIAEQMFADVSANSVASQRWSRIQKRMSALSLVKQPIVILIDHFDLVEFGYSQVIRRLMHLAEITGADLTVLVAAHERFTAPLLLDVVELSIELLPWTLAETGEFIDKATRAAGATTTLFNDDAIDSIQKLTHGVAADVIWLCDLCLLAAMSRDIHSVDGELVESAASELSPREWLLSERAVVSSRP